MSAFGAFGAAQPQQQSQQQQPGQSGGLFTGAFGASASNSNTAPATGGSLFGNNTQPQPTLNSGGGLFGSNNQAGNSGGGLFGSTTQQPAGGGLFGGTNTNQQGGGLFGNNQQAGTSNAPSGGLFGSTQQNQPGATGGGLFGSTANNNNTAGGGLFGSNAGSNNAGAGLFGNNANNTQAAAPTGGLFGSTAASNNTGGGLFGNASNTTGNTGGLFGSTTNNAPTAPSGGLFGSTAAPNTGAGLFGNTAGSSNTGSTGGLFGSTAGGTTGGLFGSTQPGASTGQSSMFGSTTQAPGSSLFGNPQQQQQQQQQQNQPGSLFGNAGQQQQQQRPGGLFGSALGGSTLGASTIGGNALLGSTNNLFSSRAVSAPNPQQDAQAQFAQLTQRIEGVAQAWNSNSPQCRFQHYFYNLVDPNQVHLYGRPQNAFNDALWQKAVRENPDPSCFVPVVATGFDDLQKRVEAQTQQAAAHQEKLKELQQRISALTQRHQLSNASRLHRASALQTQLTHRVIKLVQHLHLLIPALRSSALRPEEEALRTALEEIDDEVRRPGGTGRIRGKLNELWALVGAVTAARQQDRRTGGVEWAVVDEDGLAQIAQVLGEEQAGLAHLTKLLQKDLKDLAVIQGSSPQEDDVDMGASTATLRASTF
ncbi:nucleoporin complex subunit 54-domain-containing protein [Lenzites betulinus]|nr:nucleoporin complex subunit 54-domain-containing protein [Lenzites betulinus]